MRYFPILLVAAAATISMGAEKAGNKGGGQKAKPDEAVPQLNLDGVWRGFVVYGKGENPNRGSVHLEVTFKGNHIVSKRLDGQGGPLGEGSYKISSGRYYAIDATELKPRGKARMYLGICTFAPDTMKWCVANPGNERPTSFETKGQQFYLVLKRQRAGQDAGGTGRSK
jgi:hypothetical protein